MTSIDDIKSAIEPIYVNTFGRNGFDKLAVKVGEDHAGEMSVFVSALIHGQGSEIYSEKFTDFSQSIHSIVREFEPDKFCYMKFQFDDQSEVVDDSFKARRRKRSA